MHALLLTKPNDSQCRRALLYFQTTGITSRNQAAIELINKNHPGSGFYSALVLNLHCPQTASHHCSDTDR